MSSEGDILGDTLGQSGGEGDDGVCHTEGLSIDYANFGKLFPMDHTPQLEDILEVLRAHEADLRQQGIARAAVFGSVARHEATPASDVDILVDLDPRHIPTLLTYVGIQMTLRDWLGYDVHMAVRENLKRYIRPEVEREAVYAF